MTLSCIECGTRSLKPAAMVCSACSGLLEVHADPGRVNRRTLDARAPGVWRFAEFLPLDPVRTPPVTLGEGGTGLHECPRLATWVGVRRLFVKHEGENPTGSFKDRGMTVGVTLARSMGFDTVACASTGNTSASMAAYAARAGMTAVVLLPEGKVAAGKVAQAVAHGAKVVQVRGNFDDAMAIVRAIADEGKAYLLNSLNPYRLEGQKTLALEVVQGLGWESPEAIVYPVGNAGNISAGWKGLREARAAGLISATPRLFGVQAEGAAPLAQAFAEGRKPGDGFAPVAKPETVATAIRIGNPVNAVKAQRAVAESDGLLTSVPDALILEAQRMLAQMEGLFVEPASAASVAGLRDLVRAGKADRDGTYVCVATGHGLKDPDAVLADVKDAMVTAEATEAAVREVLAS